MFNNLKTPLANQEGSYLLFSSLSLLSVFSIYLFTLCPNIYVGDSALFASASFSLGTAHPPAYPLYCTLGKLTTFLPFGNIAYKVNLLSLIGGVISAFIVFLFIYRSMDMPYIAFIGAITASLQPLIWWECTKAEVYGVNSAMTMFVLYQGLMMLKGDDIHRRAYISALVLGLGFGNHHTIGFAGLPLLVPYVVHARRLGRGFLLLPVFFLIGFSVNLYIIFRSLNFKIYENLISYSYAENFEQAQELAKQLNSLPHYHMVRDELEIAKYYRPEQFRSSG